MPAKKTEVKQQRAGKQLQIQTAVNVKKTSCAARKRLAPATISKPSELGRTVIGGMRPCCRMLSAFCSVDRLVAEAAESRFEAGGAHSEGHMTDEQSPNPTSTLVANWDQSKKHRITSLSPPPMNRYSRFVAFQSKGTRVRHQCQQRCYQGYRRGRSISG